MTALTPWLARSPLIAILRGVRPEEVRDIAAGILGAGIAILEVPLNSPEPIESIRRLADEFGAAALVGAGTVTSVAEVDAVAAAGGRLLVMPHADAAPVRRAKALGMIALPGFFSPSEAFAMIAAGADGLKLFPAEAASPKVLRSLRAVLPPEIPVLPVGGIDAAGIAAWRAAGAAGFGIGSALYKPGMSAAEVERRAEALVAALRAESGG
ncbi:MAG TPA: 2-dehydro-3-deoxy-6-phosphogalactonate aldolase [Stellaceae bacterium]|nr:2-dehydro-3-deoxy-6-phosphogalactonate aldolase [Stellaceae bacterium]